LVWYSQEEEGRSALLAKSTTRTLAACRAKAETRASTAEVVEDFERFEKVSRTVLRNLKNSRNNIEKCLSYSPFGKSMAPWLTYCCSSLKQNWKLNE